MATRRRIATVAAILIAAAVVMFSAPVRDLIDRVLRSASATITQHPDAGMLVFVAWSIASALLAFVSSAVIVPVAVYTWGTRTTLVLLWFSWILGGICSYAIGRTLGRPLASWVVSRERIDFYASRIAKNAGFLTALLFQLAVPSEVPGYVLGTIRFRFAIYLLALALGELPFAIAAVYLGDAFIHRNYALLAVAGVAAFALSAIAIRIVHRRIGHHDNP